MKLSKSALLMYYKRPEIQQAIVDSAQDLEVATKFDFGFSKRPDILSYPDEILQLVKKGATSFHLSEERWSNPMMLSPTLKKKELEDLRIGWDLVFDIDCPWWEFSKLSAKMILEALYDHGLKKGVSIKFSGNKGFHIGVPFEAFPKTLLDGTPTEKAFPDAARIIAGYIVDYIEEKYPFVGDTINIEGKKYSFHDMESMTGLNFSDFIKKICINKRFDANTKKREICKKPIKNIDKKIVFVCPNCGMQYDSNLDFFMCEKCNVLANKEEIINKTKDDNKYCNCGSESKSGYLFDILSILDIDTILISSRHLYRSVYSFNEKSGLVGAPFNPEKIDLFEKDFCKPENVKVSKYKFLDRNSAVPNEANELFKKAHHWNEKKLQKKVYNDNKYQYEKKKFSDEVLEEEIPKDLFPPCITKGLLGMEDGKKRFMFILTNFLSMTGYEYERIEEELIEWNKVNPEALRDTILLGQARYAKIQKKHILPPNCDNNMYYKDLGICNPDNLCAKVKNPVNYSKRKARYLNHKTKKKEKNNE